VRHLRLGRFVLASTRAGGPERPGPTTVRVLVVIMLMMFLAVGCATAVPAEWTLQVEQIGSVGADPVTADTALFQPRALAFDAAGRLHILDAGNNRVQIFSSEGAFVASRGRTGEGPGDLDGPEDMWVAPDGEIVVADAGNRRIARFGAGGEPLAETHLEFTPIGVVGSGDRLFVLRLPTASMVFGPEEAPLVHALDRDGNPLQAFVTPEEQSVGILYFLANTHRIAADPDGGFALSDMHLHGRVRRFDRTGFQLEGFGLLYKAEALAPLGRLPGMISEDSLARVARTSLDVRWDPAQNLFWVLAGYVDRLVDGTWVQGNEVYRYASDGEYRGTVPLPRPARRIAPAPDGTLWILDTEGVAYRYRLRDPDVAR
jgi:hypothetical protein